MKKIIDGHPRIPIHKYTIPPPLPKKTHTFCMLNSSKVSFQMVSEKKIESEMFTDNDDGHKMMTIVHMTLRSGNLKMNFLLLINTS